MNGLWPFLLTPPSCSPDSHLLLEYSHPSSAIHAASPVPPICASPPSAEGTSLAPASAAQSSYGTLASPHPPLPQPANIKNIVLPTSMRFSQR